MTTDRNVDVDIVKLMADGLARMIKEEPQEEISSAYDKGQREHLEMVIEVADDREADETVHGVLADAAAEFGYAGGDGGVEPTPEDEYGLGVIAGWALALGYGQGIADGIEFTIGLVNDTRGVEGSVEFD